METAEVTSKQPGNDQGAPRLGRFIVVVGEAAHGGAALRIEDPARLLRVWSFLQATSGQLDSATLSPEGTPGVQRQLEAIRRELERAVSPPLAAELRRILPWHDAVPSAGALRIERAVLVGWVGSLVGQMLSALAAVQERSQRMSQGR
jgi:hypothetical protein